MNKGLLFIAFALIACCIILTKHNMSLDKHWKTAMANVKAYSDLLSQANSKSTAYQLTIDQLKYYQDSIMKELDNTRKQLKVKDKDLQAVQYITSTFTRVDTINIRDTIFKEPSFAMDTLIGDKWYNVDLGLKYPSTISIKPTFKSEKHIVVSSKKETVNPPKKFFLFRWFQKKHTVIQVDVVEKNPYVENESSKYIEIIK
jgi:hypothetical protein